MSTITLVNVSWVVYGVLALAITFLPGSVKVNDREVRNPVLRFGVGVIVVPFVGLVFYVLGVVGKFLLLPVAALAGINLW